MFDEDRYGAVYILKHRSGTTVKVGMTLVSSKERLASYVRRYELEGFAHHKDYVVLADAAREIEKAAHDALAQYRLSGIQSAREIFSCGAKVAERAIESAIDGNAKIRESRRREIEFDESFKSCKFYSDYIGKIEEARRITLRDVDESKLYRGNVVQRFVFERAYLSLAVIFAALPLGFYLIGWFVFILYGVVLYMSVRDFPSIDEQVAKIKEEDRRIASGLVAEAKEIRNRYRREYFGE